MVNRYSCRIMANERPRSYRLPLQTGYADPRIAPYDAALEEAALRLIDVVAPLDLELHFVPKPSNLSIARFVRHLVWGDTMWVPRLIETPIPGSLEAACADGALGLFVQPPEVNGTARELVDLIRRLRSEFTTPALKRVVSIDNPIPGDRGPETVEKALIHLLWHWTYHSGQVGILRELAGSDYTWTFEAR